jgi:hypothetical protein
MTKARMKIRERMDEECELASQLMAPDSMGAGH